MSETNEAEVLEKEAETAFIMGSGGKWCDAIRTDCDVAGVTRNLHDVARAVAAKARELDRARDGTLSDKQEADAMRLTLMGDRDAADVLHEHMAAQGRTIAALEAVNARLSEECKRLETVVDEARATIAAKDARIAELETQVVRVTEESQRHFKRAEERGARAILAESALATLQQAVDDAARAIVRGEYGHAEHILGKALDATPAAHPDTAALRKVRDWLDRPTGDDGSEWARGYKSAEGEVRTLLGDSGPSGGGEPRCDCGEPSEDNPCQRCEKWGPPAPTTPPDVAAKCPGCVKCCVNEQQACPEDPPDVAVSDEDPMTNEQARAILVAAGMDPDEELRKTMAFVDAHVSAQAAPTPTPEEDWRTVEQALKDVALLLPLVQGYLIQVVVTEDAPKALAALARLRDEPRRAAERMRERVIQGVLDCDVVLFPRDMEKLRALPLE